MIILLQTEMVSARVSVRANPSALGAADGTDRGRPGSGHPAGAAHATRSSQPSARSGHSMANGMAPANGMRSPSGHTPTYVRRPVSSVAFQSSSLANIEPANRKQRHGASQRGWLQFVV